MLVLSVFVKPVHKHRPWIVCSPGALPLDPLKIFLFYLCHRIVFNRWWQRVLTTFMLTNVRSSTRTHSLCDKAALLKSLLAFFYNFSFWADFDSLAGQVHLQLPWAILTSAVWLQKTLFGQIRLLNVCSSRLKLMLYRDDKLFSFWLVLIAGKCTQCISRDILSLCNWLKNFNSLLTLCGVVVLGWSKSLITGVDW